MKSSLKIRKTKFRLFSRLDEDAFAAMQMTIEKASTDNLGRLYEIEKECFQEEAFTKQQIAYLMAASNSTCLICQVKGEIVGFIISNMSVKNESVNGHILTINVLPEHRRKGVGLRLIREIEDIFKHKGVKMCHLEVREDNIAALNLYAKAGYRKAGILRHYYGNVHGVLFEKDLIRPPEG